MRVLGLKTFTFSGHFVSVLAGGAAPHWKFYRFAHVQNRLLAARDSCGQLVPQNKNLEMNMVQSLKFRFQITLTAVNFFDLKLFLALDNLFLS